MEVGGKSHSLQWGNAKGEQYTGNPYVRFDEGTEVVRPPPTLLTKTPRAGVSANVFNHNKRRGVEHGFTWLSCQQHVVTANLKKLRVGVSGES